MTRADTLLSHIILTSRYRGQLSLSPGLTLGNVVSAYLRHIPSKASWDWGFYTPFLSRHWLREVSEGAD